MARRVAIAPVNEAPAGREYLTGASSAVIAVLVGLALPGRPASPERAQHDRS